MISDYIGPTPTERFAQRVLFDYSEGDHEFEKELIESYMNSVKEHLPQLSDSFKTKDIKGAILHSHDIKGSSSYIGCEAVRYLSGKIEAYCKSEELEQAKTFYSELLTEVSAVFKELNDYMVSWDDVEVDISNNTIDDIIDNNNINNNVDTGTNNDNNNNNNDIDNNEDNSNSNSNTDDEEYSDNNKHINNENSSSNINNNINDNNNNDNNSNNIPNNNITLNCNINESSRSKSPIPQGSSIKTPITETPKTVSDKIATETVNNNNNNNNINNKINGKQPTQHINNNPSSPSTKVQTK